MSVHKHISFQSYLILLVFVGAALMAVQLRPTHRIADDREKVNLKQIVPENFGNWHRYKKSSGYIINPEVKQRLDGLYSQTLSRTYVSKEGKYIMLSIAYGADQSDAKQMHYPEVCYPSQGFQIKSSEVGSVKTDHGSIKVRRLYAKMGSRTEPVTYWTTVGNKVVLGGRETKLEKLKYSINGEIPDGLLFRVSSISDDKKAAYAFHQRFINDLISNLNHESRLRIAGIND